MSTNAPVPARTRGADHSPLAPLAIHDLTVAYHRKPVLWDVDLEVPAGKLIGIVGPNGAGKSTLIKAVLDLLPRASGRITIFGKPYKESRSRVGYVPQRESVDWDFPVSALDVVAMGRYGKIGWFRPVTRSHKEAAMEALDRVGIADLAHRQISQNLAIHFDLRGFQARNEPRVADAVQAHCGVDALNPQAPEIALLVATVAVAVGRGVEQRLGCHAVIGAARATKTLGAFENDFVSTATDNTGFSARH